VRHRLLEAELRRRRVRRAGVSQAALLLGGATFSFALAGAVSLGIAVRGASGALEYGWALVVPAPDEVASAFLRMEQSSSTTGISRIPCTGREIRFGFQGAGLYMPA